ncbi:MAG: hypothetical protein AB9856_09215 [Cellulosilyticaceae bacterium]
MGFDYIIELRSRLKNPGKGKGCVNVKFTDNDEMTILFEAIKEIVARNNKNDR